MSVTRTTPDLPFLSRPAHASHARTDDADAAELSGSVRFADLLAAAQLPAAAGDAPADLAKRDEDADADASALAASAANAATTDLAAQAWLAPWSLPTPQILAASAPAPAVAATPEPAADALVGIGTNGTPGAEPAPTGPAAVDAGTEPFATTLAAQDVALRADPFADQGRDPAQRTIAPPAPAAPAVAAADAALAAVPVAPSAAMANASPQVPNALASRRNAAQALDRARDDSASSPPGAAAAAPGSATSSATPSIAAGPAAPTTSAVTALQGLAPGRAPEGRDEGSLPTLMPVHPGGVSDAVLATASTPKASSEATVTPAAAASADGATPLNGLSPDVRAAERAGEPIALHVERPVASPGWHEAVGSGIAEMVALKQDSAQLHVNPSHLGPVDIRITVSGNEASVQLVAAHPATREALEGALPVLRDLLASQGLSLGQAAVDSRARQDQAPQATPTPSGTGVPGGAIAAATDDVPRAVARAWRLLDVFA